MFLQVAPEVLGRIEFWSVGRKPLELEALLVLRDKIANLAASMDGKTIPDHQQGTGQLAQQAAEKVDHLRCTDRAGIEAKIEVPPCDTPAITESVFQLKWYWRTGV